MSRKQPSAPVEETPEPEDLGRPIRREHRNNMIDLKALTNQISRLPQAVRRRLPLDEDVQAQLDRLAAADPRSDRRRVLMRAKLLLGGADLVRLHAALAGDTVAAAWDRESDRWRTRLIAGADADLQSFVEAYPGADRLAIRTSLREARGKGPAAVRATNRLLHLVRAAAVPDPAADEAGGDAVADEGVEDASDV